MRTYIFVIIWSVFLVIFMEDVLIAKLLSDAIPFFESHEKALKPFETRDVTEVIAVGILVFKLFIMSGLFILLYPSLWGNSGVVKGLFYGSMLWFFLVVMPFTHPKSLKYDISIGGILYIFFLFLVMFLLLGLLYGLILKPLSAIVGKDTQEK